MQFAFGSCSECDKSINRIAILSDAFKMTIKITQTHTHTVYLVIYIKSAHTIVFVPQFLSYFCVDYIILYYNYFFFILYFFNVIFVCKGIIFDTLNVLNASSYNSCILAERQLVRHVQPVSDSVLL